MAEDENLSVLMDSLRGANLNEDNFAKEVNTVHFYTRKAVQADWRLKIIVSLPLTESLRVQGLKMRLMEEYEDGENFSDELPLVYDPEAIASYWGKRRGSIAKRVLQLSQVSSGFISSLLLDLVRGELKKNEVQRAIELRDIITSLGPAYIKLGKQTHTHTHIHSLSSRVCVRVCTRA